MTGCATDSREHDLAGCRARWAAGDGHLCPPGCGCHCHRAAGHVCDPAPVVARKEAPVVPVSDAPKAANDAR